MKKVLLAAFGIVALSTSSVVAQDITLVPDFQRFVGGSGDQQAASWFTTGDIARSGAANVNSTYPGGTSIIIPARGGDNLIRVIDDLDGSELGTLNMTDVSGGTFPYNAVGATSTGQIYAGNLIIGAATFKVYKWDNDTSTTLPLAFEVSASNRVGDGLNAYANPDNTDEVTVVAVGNNAASPLVIMQSTDGGDTFNSSTIPNVHAIGVATDGERVFTKRPSANIEVFDIATLTKIGEITPRSGFAGTTSALDFYKDGSRELLALASYASGTQYRVHVYDITNYDIVTGTDVPDWPYQVDAVAGAPTNGNTNGTAGVSLWRDGDLIRVAHVSSNNLYAAYSSPTGPAVVGDAPELGNWSIPQVMTEDDDVFEVTRTLNDPAPWKVWRNASEGWGSDIGRMGDGNQNMPDFATTGTITYYYDTRDLSGTGWQPETESLGATSASNVPWVAVGNFQADTPEGGEWNPDSTVTVLTDPEEDGIFSYSFVASAGRTDAIWKAVSNTSPSWGDETKFGTNGWSVDPGDSNNQDIPAYDAGDTVTLEFDAWRGRLRATVAPASSVNDWMMLD
ncbi:MAG: hypothetical protein JJU11_07950 [Candidatus Sumerlaeia bacterium]|nr:hypothetical protein [Candidatus Sumerlaeia bacterium]